ncbi:unnamed protein product [Moneuplotes crassus]|uniref:Ankyrin repeat domain-containing protein n=1 Tax=Euplotes crassus TaxID=5936 RepID=A0AAD1XV42_EUPCR|nr:unnamed protein product [Moneuplotes crassus]CAI2379224.1 unnamed protein product [Moneuplotes crassus]
MEISISQDGLSFVPKVTAEKYNPEKASKRRSRVLVKKLKTADKMEIYASATQGKLEIMKTLIEEKKVSILEEVSKSGYFWTAFHFASHYGSVDVLNYLVDCFWDHPYKFDIFNIQTIEGKTPLFCCISSGDIKKDKKKEIIKIWIDTQNIDFSLRKKTGEDLLQLAKKNSLYEYLEELLLFED